MQDHGDNESLFLDHIQWWIKRGEGRAGSAPPPLNDGLTPLLTVIMICDNGTILWRHHRHFYLFKHVKHGIRRIFKIIATSGFVTALDRTKFVFGRGSPGPRWGSLQRSPRLPIAGLRGPTSKGGWKGKGKVREEEGRKQEGRGWEVRLRPFANS